MKISLSFKKYVVTKVWMHHPYGNICGIFSGGSYGSGKPSSFAWVRHSTEARGGVLRVFTTIVDKFGERDVDWDVNDKDLEDAIIERAKEAHLIDDEGHWKQPIKNYERHNFYDSDSYTIGSAWDSYDDLGLDLH